MQADITTLDQDDRFQERMFSVIYVRFLLMHIINPLNAIKQMLRVLKPGGRLLIQESIMDTLTSIPHCPVVDRYKTLVIAAGRAQGTDYNIGSRLEDLLIQAGVDGHQIETYYRRYSVREGGATMLVDRLDSWGPHAIELNVITQKEFDLLRKDLESLVSQKYLSMNLAVQVHVIATIY